MIPHTCDGDGSYVSVPANLAAKAAGRLKARVMRRRMRWLRNDAIEECSTRKYVFFGPRRVPTEREVRDKMRELWRTGGYDLIGQVRVDFADSVMTAAKVSADGRILLSLGDLRHLRLDKIVKG